MILIRLHILFIFQYSTIECEFRALCKDTMERLSRGVAERVESKSTDQRSAIFEYTEINFSAISCVSGKNTLGTESK